MNLNNDKEFLFEIQKKISKKELNYIEELNLFEINLLNKDLDY